MKIHRSVVDKILYLCQTFGGYENETKLRAKINELDLTPYERKEKNSGETILVLTEDYLRQLQPKQR